MLGVLFSKTTIDKYFLSDIFVCSAMTYHNGDMIDSALVFYGGEWIPFSDWKLIAINLITIQANNWLSEPCPPYIVQAGQSISVDGRICDPYRFSRVYPEADNIHYVIDHYYYAGCLGCCDA